MTAPSSHTNNTNIPSYVYKNHTSVLKNEVLNYLTDNLELSISSSSHDYLFADLTFGGGGHTFSLLEKMQSHSNININIKTKVIAFDQDPDAISNGKENIAKLSLDDKITLIHSNFSNFPKYIKDNYSDILSANDSKIFSGILLDLGVSSHQLDTTERGLSFRGDAPLDMRMNYLDKTISTASDYINTLEEDELVRIISEYGEDRFAKRIASAITEKRKIKPIETTLEL